MKSLFSTIGWVLSGIAAIALALIAIPTIAVFVLLALLAVFGIFFFFWAIGTPFVVRCDGVKIGYLRWTKFTKI